MLLSACRQQNGLEHKSATLQMTTGRTTSGENGWEQQNSSDSSSKQRRSQSAWRKVILRLAHQMTSIGVSASS